MIIRLLERQNQHVIRQEIHDAVSSARAFRLQTQRLEIHIFFEKLGRFLLFTNVWVAVLERTQESWWIACDSLSWS